MAELNALELRLSIEPDGRATVALIIDGRDLELPVDLANFAACLDAPGDYFILTCTCGIPQCNNLWRAIAVTHAGEDMLWEIVQPAPARSLRFSRAAGRQALGALTDAVRKKLFVRRLLASGDAPLEILPEETAEFLAGRLPDAGW